MSINESLTKFIEIKNKLEELQKRYEKYRKIVEDHMTKDGLTVLTHDSYEIKKIPMHRETISKKELPKDVWEKYSKALSYSMIRVKKI